MKKLFSIAAALLFGLSAMAVEPTLEHTDWVNGETNFENVFTTVSGVTLTTDATEWKGNLSGHNYICSGGGTDFSATWANYFQVAATNKIDSIAVFWAPNGSNNTNIAWCGWESGVTPNVEVGSAHGVTALYTATKSYSDAIWQTINLTSYNLTTVLMSRQIKKAKENGTVLANFGGNQTVNFLGIKVWVSGQAAPTKYTVSYYDGATLLGSERVEEGSYATKASTFETKARHTFDGWYNDAALTSAANVATTAITADKSFYGKWTAEPVTYSSSLNIEQGVLDNSKAWDIEGAFAAAHIGYANINALDSLNSSSTANNEPFLGLKLKTAGAYVEVGLHAGDVLRVKFGNVADDIKVNGATVAKANLSAPYEHTAAADEYVRFETTTKNTVVLKQIMINEAIAAVALPGNETNTKLATLTLDGTAIEGFSSSKTTYDITLPEETTTAPIVAATAEGVGAVVGEITQATAIPGSATFTVTAANGTTTATYTINFSHLRGGKALTNVKFSNGAYGAIDETAHTVTVAYMGTMPTVEESSVVVSEGASAAFAAEAITVTAEDGTTQAYAIEGHALVASAALDTEITFDGTEAYVYAHYGWDAEKGIKFAKKVDDASNMRIAKGNTRIYMALPAAAEVDLTSGTGGARNVKIFVNGVESSVTKTAAANSAITISLSQSGDNFVMIDSNQEGGDGGFIKMFVRSEVATGMEEIATEKAVKFIENGQLYILKNGVRYNALGAVVE